MLDADLDTGAHGTFADASLREASTSPAIWFSGRHLGRLFEWSPDRVDVTVALGDGSVCATSLPVRWVREWAKSPFVRLNAHRRVLVGRDLLRALGLELTLRARSAETEVLGAGPARG